MSAAAVIILHRKKFIRRFLEQGATSPDQAIPFADVGMRRSWVFDRMVARGVFVRVGQDRYYMNEPAAQAFLAAQRRWALIVTGVLLFLFLIFLLASTRWWLIAVVLTAIVGSMRPRWLSQTVDCAISS